MLNFSLSGQKTVTEFGCCQLVRVFLQSWRRQITSEDTTGSTSFRKERSSRTTVRGRKQLHLRLAQASFGRRSPEDGIPYLGLTSAHLLCSIFSHLFYPDWDSFVLTVFIVPFNGFYLCWNGLGSSLGLVGFCGFV